MILLVEDDEDVRELLEFTFRSSGYAVHAVSDGNAALAFLETQRPCVMILDLVMPRMTGWEVVERMRARQQGDIPVCVISALAGKVPPEAVATFAKPFDVRELVTVVGRYCTHAAG